MGLLVDTLTSVGFLRGAAQDAVLRFMVLGKSRDYNRGHRFWRVDSPPQGIVIPVTGEAKAFSCNTDGREYIDAFAGPGECIGIESALDGLPHPNSAEVIRKGEFFTMSANSFQRYLREQPQIVSPVMAIMSRRLRQTLQERHDIALTSVKERIARFLLESACLRAGDGAKVLVDATQAELAARLGTVREVVARVLADFTSRGLVSKTPKGLFVEDWEGLCAEGQVSLEARVAVSDDDAYGPSSEIRTRRFFLSMADKRKRGISNDPELCREHLGDLSGCRSKGCPGAAHLDC